MVALASWPDHGLAFMPARETLTHIEYRGIRPMTTVKLSPSEEKLIASIIEHIYPEPKEGSVLPVEDGEKRAARGLERKGLVVLSICERGFDRMTFTALGQSIYERQLAAANS
ncbi:hypothetical protein [Stutzerimonas stutzeri]|uniref:hypothetical protein n=1 Tax=Stutzerimonas stutzeri TaxID=316 RepID=UPI0015E3933B|nr:hypothetical protein [Stutzerimonas stutzeri]MBA1280281.1 hypothetical protein [Stutzerimonas stutzeri]